ncbi:ATPase domain-containing protein [Pseudomonas sp. DTU_2021_1001937_2_SI_NGA_ILE_001]|uniref:ATPase domain-containing protein n=1 Tax=Pseudomonas sp. DTU_2021_1001937_2_SI_NGA_ILE_001 TaxID=3077589 RepID=UPI0028FC18DD|nr:ATPase domain-containing protein [Pseudomonas sp. DTU_2021_1001937_2_SI_NGA_ILE_001]WNW14343.1 ATPase domain-containing protein [Pseudomonas sp. DTU_2021_1001937_2_SI_NGA_ILE_001]
MLNQLKRLQSGIEGLDELLKGGFVSGSSYIIQGRPGSGKTILANQIGFNHVRDGGRVLFATLLAEPHERLFQFLSTLSFFDKSRIGAEIQFISAFDTMENEGLDEVVKLLRREIARQKSTVMILDGLLNARSKADSPLNTKRFISELQGHAAFAGCTVFFLTSSQLDDGSPEHTMVDGVLELGEEQVGSRMVRRIKMRKTRGSAALSGDHECEITDDGLVVYPRLESTVTHSAMRDSETLGLIPSGIASLDPFIGGGLVGSSVSLVMGPSGAGKTSIGLSFLAESTVQDPGLHFGFYESPQRLRLKAKALGHDFEALEASGALTLAWRSITTEKIDKLAIELLRLVERKSIKRVFIDSLGGMGRTAADKSRVLDIYTALMGELRSRNVTVVASWEVRSILGEVIDAPASDLSGIVDNLLLVRFAETGAELTRHLSILKVRDSAYDPALLELVIDKQGIDVRKALSHVFDDDSGVRS